MKLTAPGTLIGKVMLAVEIYITRTLDTQASHVLEVEWPVRAPARIHLGGFGAELNTVGKISDCI